MAQRNVVLDHSYESGLVRCLLYTLCGYVHEFWLWLTFREGLTDRNVDLL